MQQLSIQFKMFFNQFPNYLISAPWAWWAAGIGIGLTAVALAWFTGKKLGVTGGFEDACSMIGGEKAGFTPSPSHWKLWFILGLPLGGLLANVGHLGWTLTYGRLDEITFGNLVWKGLWLLVSGFLIGLGARWAGGCVSGNSIMGISTGSKMSILATVAFLVAGILITNILFKIF
jgi:uncharacterized protein